MSAISIALSGMRVAEARLEASSANIANMTNSGAVPDGSAPAGANPVFQPVRVNAFSTGSDGQPGGAGFSFSRDASAFTTVSDPTSPDANGKGLVAVPNVDIAQEALNLITARIQFEASAKVVGLVRDMQKSTLDTLA